MAAVLKDEEMNAREISRELGIAEKDVVRHLEHLARTAAASGGRLRMNPAVCEDCGFVFRERRRFSKPGRCPRCKGTHLRAPSYFIES
jgi:predicted Zn-ribbon and HTH transcriptional regulator